ncbi:MAG TPA: hypothetical protein VFC61_09590, partial [Blastocatellia bacterium]|nr:hypothetical protein [Blastocatellia bacterium]
MIATFVGALVAIAALAGSMASSAASGQASGQATFPASLASTAPSGASAAKGVCATIDRNNVEMQMNARAGEILAACGRSPSRPPQGAIFSSLAQLSSAPGDYGGADVNVILPDGASPHVTQSEVQVWAQGNTVVAAYNDSRTAPSCYSGGSYSTNGGATWTRLATNPFCSGHGTGYGDPVVYY